MAPSGLDAPILNPMEEDMISTIRVLMCCPMRIRTAKHIKAYSAIEQKPADIGVKEQQRSEKVIIDGIKDEAASPGEGAKESSGLEIVDNYLHPL